jgi:hypothetical protein
MFSKDEEDEISNRIRNEYLANRRLFTDIDFVDVVSHYWANKNRNNIEQLCKFQISKGWIWRFKQRNRFSSRKINIKRRPTIVSSSYNNWIKKIQSLIQADSSIVFNGDETTWQLVPNGLRTWADTGSESVEVYFNGDPKKRITALCTISADGVRLPIQLIAKGTTNRVHSSWLGDTHELHWHTHSKSAWTTQETFLEYLNHLRNFVNEQSEHSCNKRIHLILDLYAVNRSDTSKKRRMNST